ncbi:MAG: class I adenylate-forming enzyme family protein [Candidatus Altiarchaeota archaeon]
MKFEDITNISSSIAYYADKNPDKIFLIQDEEKYSFSKINNLLDRVCSLYESLGLRKGDIISAVIKNSVEYILLYLSALRLGCIFNPYPYTLDGKDISRYIENMKPRITLCQESHYPDLKTNTPSDIFLIETDFIDSLKKTKQNYIDFVPKKDSPACVYYSSGTTGNPKGVVFSHNNIIKNISSIIRGFRFDENEVHLIILPLGHTASINYSFLPCTLCGGTLVLTESFWKIRAKFWKIMREQNITYVEVVPSILVALLNTPYKKNEFENIRLIRFIGCGSATLPKDTQVKFMQKYGIRVANLYGLSETGPTHIDYPLDEGWKPGSIGKPLDVNEAKIMDEQNHILGPGEIGEIVIKGENVFIGYRNNERLYNKVVKDNYFHTGDLGYVTRDNTFFFTGRKKDLIIKGGVNISPDEIDEILSKMDEIKEVATVGVPDEYLGEKIVSFIVLKEDKNIRDTDIINFCKKYISRDKIPDKVEFVDNIPKGPSGKNLRRKLRGVSNEK